MLSVEELLRLLFSEGWAVKIFPPNEYGPEFTVEIFKEDSEEEPKCYKSASLNLALLCAVMKQVERDN